MDRRPPIGHHTKSWGGRIINSPLGANHGEHLHGAGLPLKAASDGTWILPVVQSANQVAYRAHYAHLLECRVRPTAAYEMEYVDALRIRGVKWSLNAEDSDRTRVKVTVGEKSYEMRATVLLDDGTNTSLNSLASLGALYVAPLMGVQYYDREARSRLGNFTIYGLLLQSNPEPELERVGLFKIESKD
jgi:hypothetical protein